jgi:hypothetical protein
MVRHHFRRRTGARAGSDIDHGLRLPESYRDVALEVGGAGPTCGLGQGVQSTGRSRGSMRAGALRGATRHR